MSELESSAERAGHRWVVLNTGDRQPEALALYGALGYVPVPGYGIYADAPGAVFLGKALPPSGCRNRGSLDDEEEAQSWAS